MDDQQITQMLLNPETQRQGFEAAVRQYGEQLYWQVRKIVLTHDDADDVVQNAFLKAWNALDTFGGDSKAFTWLSRIAINEALDLLRKNKRRMTVSEDEYSVASSLLADPYFDGTDVQRTVFQLRYFDELKYSDISQMLGTTEGSLKASYHIAVKKISEFFKLRD